MKHLRVRLRDEFGFPKSETHAQAYWYYGRAFGANRSKATAEPEAPAVPEPSVPESVMSEPTVSEPEAPPAAEPAGTWRSRAGSRLVAPLKRTLILAGVVQALITLLELAPFVLLVELARRLLAGESGTRLFSPAITALVLVGLGALLTAGLMTAMHRLDARFGRDLRERLLTKLSRLPLGWFDSRGSGAVKSLVQDDVLSLHYLVTHAIPDAVRAAVAPVAVLLYLFVVDWRLGLVLFLPVLAYLVGMAIMVVQSGPRTAEAGRWNERMNTEAGAYLEGQRVIRVFGGAASSRFRSKLDQYIQFVVDWQRPMSGQKTFIDQVTRPMTFLVLISVVGTALITAGWMDPVSLLPFLLLGTTFGSKLLGIGFGLSGLQEGLLAAKRIQVTLEEKELAVADGAASATASPADDRSGLVELDHVTFSYRPGVPVLEDVSLRLEPGTVTALVGPSGSGKSTLAALLARFHDVDAGTVSIGGSDVRDLSSEELYRRIGFVFQQTQLVQGSVRENIALARPDAADTEVEAAARAARIHERILRLPQGYATELGPDAALSGGERQRLCIARAILADTPVLVLDEATSFADPESEYQVQRALNALTTGRTVVVIAHRLHTVTGADQMIVLDDGRVAETGTHAALLEQDGRYRRLWEHGNTETHALVGEDR
jgi:ATP-binding cassette subfamily B protein IrtA